LEKKKTIFIDKRDEGKYLKIPIEVPKNIERIIFTYEYERFEDNVEKNIIDFGVYSPEGFLGASGSNRQTIQISTKSDEGFKHTAIIPGTWEVMAGVYKVADEGIEVTYTIQFVEKERLLLNGDTHVHTLSSDGSYSYFELVEKAEKEELDFLILADHNNFIQNDQITERENLVIIPGTEWTLYNGHANFIGAKKAIEDPFDVVDKDGVKEKFKEAKSNDALVSINHPFCPYCSWKWGMDELDYDLIEIWNGGLVQEANVKALEWWNDQLKSGKRIPVIAGSDFHKVEGYRNIGQPLTRVWTNSKAKQAILDAIKNGHTFISYAVNAPTIYMETANGMLGDVVSDREVSITIRDLNINDEIQLITDKEVENIHVTDVAKEMTIERTYDSESYVRVEIYRPVINEALKMPVSLSNPIYFE